jgi:hypothetical protein
MHASMGMLFEQASSVGLIDTPHGLLSFRDNIRTQYRSSMEMIRAGLEMKDELLQYQREFSRETAELAAEDDIQAYVFSSPGDNARAYHAIDILNRHQIEVNRLAEDIEIDGVLYPVGGSYIVRTGQPQYRMIKALFELITEFEDETFYDVSAWTLPLAFDFDFSPLSSRELRSNVVGDLISAVFPAAPVPTTASYAYLFDWSNYYAPRALYRLLDAGVLPKVATQPITIFSNGDVVSLPAGAILVPLGWQGGDLSDDEIHALMGLIAEEDGIEVHPVNSGRTPQIGMDLGSRNFVNIPLPKILLLVGEGMASYDAGEVWHHLDARMNIPVHMVNKRELGGLDLHNYTHVVLVGGNHSDIESMRGGIDDWVRNGGTLIGIRQGARWAHDNILYQSATESISGNGSESERFDYAEKNEIEAQDIIGGAIFAGDLDVTHPIGFGIYNRNIASQRNTMIAFDPPENPWATLIKIPENALLSGFASGKNQEALAGKAMAIAERRGQGSVILFADNPNFRAYFFGTNKLFTNSLFFSLAFDRPR